MAKLTLKNIKDVDFAKNILDALKFETKAGKKNTFRFECVKNVKRTLNQNSYYWGIVVKYIQEKTGYTKDEVHAYFIIDFVKNNPDTVKYFIKNDVVFGKNIKTKISTTDFDTIVFTKYIEYIRDFCKNCEALDYLYIPLPNEIPDDLRY